MSSKTGSLDVPVARVAARAALGLANARNVRGVRREVLGHALRAETVFMLTVLRDSGAARSRGSLAQERVGGALAADRCLVAVPGEHDGVVRQRQAPRCAATPSIAAWSPPGRSVRPMEPANSRSPENITGGVVRVVRRPERHRPACMAGRVVDGEVRPASSSACAVGELAYVVGLGELVLPAEQHRARLCGHAPHRVGQQVPVLGVDPGRGVVAAAHRRDATTCGRCGRG